MMSFFLLHEERAHGERERETHTEREREIEKSHFVFENALVVLSIAVALWY